MAHADTPSATLGRPSNSPAAPVPIEQAHAGPEIVVVPYDPVWPELYIKESELVRQALGDLALEVHHIGSTAVPGLSSKPLIDIFVAVEKLQGPEVYEKPLAPLSYVYQDVNDPERHFYRKVPRVRHVHVAEHGSIHYWRFLLFRERMRRDPAMAKSYEILKKRMAVIYANNRDAYTQSKSEFITSVVAQEIKQRPDVEAQLKARGWRPPTEPEVTRF